MPKIKIRSKKFLYYHPVPLRVPMGPSMASEETLRLSPGGLLKINPSPAVRPDRCGCEGKVNEPPPVFGTMWVMTYGAGRFLINDMPLVLPKTFIVENAVPAVAFVAEGIGIGALCRVIPGLIVFPEEIFKIRAMGSFCPISVVGAMAIRAGDDASYRIGREKTRRLPAHPWRLYWVKRRIGRVKLFARVEFVHLSCNRQIVNDVVVGMALEAYFMQVLGVLYLLSTSINPCHSAVGPAHHRGVWGWVPIYPVGIVTIRTLYMLGDLI